MSEKKFFKPEFSQLVEVAEEKCRMLNVFFTAPSLEELEKSVQVIPGPCAKKTALARIVFNKEYRFKVGDPIKFPGVPVGLVSLPGDSGNEYVVIRIVENVFCYSLVHDNFCLFLEIINYFWTILG